MFKKTSSENELIQNMGYFLNKNAQEKAYGLSKFAKAMENLISVAQTLDDIGMADESEELTEFIEKMVENLEETGTVFPENMFADDIIE